MPRQFLLGRPVLLMTLIFCSASTIYADRITMRNGDIYDGIVIEAVARGEVFVELDGEVVTFDIRDVESMNFDTPHLSLTGYSALDHFLADVEAQEVVEDFAVLDDTADELERLMTQVRTYWGAREPIEPRDVQAWEAARDTFRLPLSRYQEVLNDLYFHVLAKVDEYNAVAQEAEEIYVGVRGLLQVGSPLLPDGMEELSLRDYVPATWYDTIYYDGYGVGYNDAFERREEQEPPN